MIRYLNGIFLMFEFWVKYLFRLHKLPPEMKNANAMHERMALNQTFVVETSRDLREDYNRDYENLKHKIRDLGNDWSFRQIQIAFVAIRFSCIVAAWLGYFKVAVGLSMLQFVSAPYSFVIATAYCITLGPPIYWGHYLTFSVAALAKPYLPWFLSHSVTITTGFVIAYIVIDQLACWACMYYNPAPNNKPVNFPMKTHMAHVLWGSFNCKSFHLVLLPLIRGCEINIFFWLLDAVFGFSFYLAKFFSVVFLHWAPLFYHTHRLGHLPKVYEHAHKFHHFLQGTNAFDAHIFGSGAPEEWNQLIMELLYCRFWMVAPPACLGYDVLRLSLANKFGHTHLENDAKGISAWNRFGLK